MNSIDHLVKAVLDRTQDPRQLQKTFTSMHPCLPDLGHLLNGLVNIKDAEYAMPLIYSELVHLAAYKGNALLIMPTQFHFPSQKDIPHVYIYHDGSKIKDYEQYEKKPFHSGKSITSIHIFITGNGTIGFFYGYPRSFRREVVMDSIHAVLSPESSFYGTGFEFKESEPEVKKWIDQQVKDLGREKAVVRGNQYKFLPSLLLMAMDAVREYQKQAPYQSTPGNA